MRAAESQDHVAGEVTPAATPLDVTVDGAHNVSPEEAARLQKLGVLAVNLGIAKEEQIFGQADSAAMRAYRSRKIPDLLVINRHEDDAERHPLVWYDPRTWFTSGRQVSPMLWRSGAVPASVGSTQTEIPALAERKADADAREVAQRVAAVKGRAGLPPVHLRALTPEEVAQLTPNVRAERTKLLQAEENIHQTLQGIADTRHRYLVPSLEISCEPEVHRLVRCYTRQNAAAEAKRAALLHERDVLLAQPYSNRVQDGDAGARLVMLDALQCGPLVQQLKACTAKTLEEYSRGEAAA